jgi:hypothetical protein
MFLTCINAITVAAAFSTNHTNIAEIPHDVVKGMVHETIMDNNVLSLLGKRRNHVDDDGVRNKSCCIMYDHKHAQKCVNNDWMGLNPQFPDKSFKQMFQINRSMVDEIIINLAIMNFSGIKWNVVRPNKQFAHTLSSYVHRRFCVLGYLGIHSLITFKRTKQLPGDSCLI